MKKVIICPFCGEHEAKVEKTFVLKYRVRCPKCNVAQLNQYDTEDEAIKEWNTRIPMKRIVEKMEEYRNDFMYDVYEELRDDSDNLRANRIIERFDNTLEIVKEEMT